MTTQNDPRGLIDEFHRLRKRVFVKAMGRQISHGTKHGGVLGGARLLPTTHVSESGKSSYMIRDAYLGRLPGIPSVVCTKDPPCEKNTWELSRIVSFGLTNLGPKILLAANKFLLGERANSCLFLGPPAFMRMARSMGFPALALGPVQSNEDGRFLAFCCTVVPNAKLSLANR